MTKPERSTEPARLIIADDHELSRIGLRGMLADERGLRIIGEAASGREAVELCRRIPAPDLAILDVRMPDLDGLTATRAIKEISPRISVLILTSYESHEYVVEALRAGAAGYLLKDVGRSELVQAVRRILRGESILTGQRAAQILYRLATTTERSVAPLAEPLTPREIEVLRLVVHGKTNREIAGELVISAGTVKNHVEHIIAKLGVSDRTQAAVYALRCGLVSSEQL